MSTYVQREDGEGFEVPSGERYRIACCDCGLVHEFVFVSHDGKPIGIAAKRNNRSTAQRRRNAVQTNAPPDHPRPPFPEARIAAVSEPSELCKTLIDEYEKRSISGATVERIIRALHAPHDAHPPTSEWNDAIEAAAMLVWNNGEDIRPVAEAIRGLKK